MKGGHNHSQVIAYNTQTIKYLQNIAKGLISSVFKIR